MANAGIVSGDGNGRVANVSEENRLQAEARVAAGNASVETEAAVTRHALHELLVSGDEEESDQARVTDSALHTKVRSGDEEIESEALVTNHRLHTLAHLAPDDYAVDTSSVTVTDSGASTILDTATDGMGFVIQNLASAPLAIVLGSGTPDSNSLRIAPGDKLQCDLPVNVQVRGILIGSGVSGTAVGLRFRKQ